MAKPETLQTIKSILRDSLRIGPETDIRDDMPLKGGQHDIDSLDTLLVITNIEKRFEIKILDPSVDRRVFATVTSLADFVDLRRA